MAQLKKVSASIICRRCMGARVVARQVQKAATTDLFGNPAGPTRLAFEEEPCAACMGTGYKPVEDEP